MPFTIFYDSQCPLCVAEMSSLRDSDVRGALQLEDIHADDFAKRYPYIDKNSANNILHGLNERGELLLGLDVTVGAWQRVGKHRWLVILRWPMIQWFADKTYLFFAKHRQRISRILTGSRTCTSDLCSSQRKPAARSRNCVRNINEDAEF